jgi:hypothetical protein
MSIFSIGSLVGNIHLTHCCNWKGSCVFLDPNAARLTTRRGARRDLLFGRTGWTGRARLRDAGGTTGAGGTLEGGPQENKKKDAADDRVHATIAKSRRVLEMQSTLLEQVSLFTSLLFFSSH